jgi:hypothetical protein
LRSQWISGQWNPLDEAGDDIDTHFSA